MRPWVLKLGGSLGRGPHLRSWLELFSGQRCRPLVVVPGGGAFAEAVRQAQERHGFDDRTGHRMALLAMAQYGLMLASLAGGLPCITQLAPGPLTAGSHIWLPTGLLDRETGPGQDWEHTSDSIALWLAGALGAGRLVVVKSVTPPGEENFAPVLARQGIVDTAFPRLLRGYRGRCNWLGPRQHGLLEELLAGHRSVLPLILPD